MVSLYANTPTSAWSPGTTITTTDPHSHGPEFVADGGYVHALRWYRRTTADTVPYQLYLWDTTTELNVAGAVHPGGTVAVGWNSFPLASPVALVAGRPYRVAAYWDVGAQIGWTDTALRVAAPAPLQFSDYGRYYATGPTFPDAPVLPTMAPVDIVWGPDQTPPDQNVTNEELTAQLAAWLSADGTVQQHESDGLPWLIKTELDATKLIVQANYDYWTHVPPGGSSLLDYLGHMSPTLLQVMAGFFGGSMDPIPMFTRDPVTGAPATGNALTDLYNQLSVVINNAVPPAPPPATWTLVGEQTFDTWLYWNQAAQYYLVHFADLGSATRIDTPAGIPVAYRLAWWTPHDGAGGRERRFIDLADYYCDDGGRMMPGLFLHSPAGGSGTVQAYTS